MSGEDEGRGQRRGRPGSGVAVSSRGGRAGAGRSLLESGAPGTARADSSAAFNFPCFLGILILFSGKLPVP